MASFTKSKLKAARDAITKKDYKAAQEAASQVLEFESSNYTANVFLGLACLELGDHTRSQQAYIRATESSPDQPLAWQGLARFYERTEQWQAYTTSLRTLMDIFMKADDAIKCAETLQKYLEVQRERGTRQDISNALRLLLPESPLYPILSTLPEPQPTAPSTSLSYIIVQTAIYNSLPVFEELVELLEKDETEMIKREVDKRRMRLGAGRPEQIKSEVHCEVQEHSKLPELYNEIINHPNTTDELRRSTEAKLLQQKLQLLVALPVVGDKLSLKKELLSQVQSLCNGMVLLAIPNELAWIFYMESMDVYDIDEYDMSVLRRYMKVFPSTHLTQLLRGYFDYMQIPLEEPVEEEGRPPDPLDAALASDPVSTILEAFSYLSNSIISHRITSEVYRMEEDLENAIKTAESGLQLTSKTVNDYGKPLPKVKRAFQVTLALSLVNFFPPKHHIRAFTILEEVLSQDPNNVHCLLSKGYILQSRQQWKEAEGIFETVLKLSPEYDMELESLEEKAWCIVKDGRLLEGIDEYCAIIEDIDKEVGRDDQKARAYWRLGQAYWNLGDEHKETAYKHFIASLKRSSSFAPAFTSLGIYYADYVNPPDLDRSSKCFQKAFEIDAREGEAARRLAEGFSNEREWDLVEVVARRTIEGEGGLEGGMAGTEDATSRYMPTNAWAWKAVGVVELSRKNYLAATQAFQIALRADNDDFVSWQRLGEAYFRSGRQAAAIKALKHALTLREDDWICHFLLAEVFKVMTQYSEAIASYQTALELQPAEMATLLALAEVHLIYSRNQSLEGFRSRAESSALASIDVCIDIIEKSSGFRRIAWKTAADAVYELSKASTFDDTELVAQTLLSLLSYISEGTTNDIQGLISFPNLSTPESVDGLYALKVAVAAYDHRTSLDNLDNIAAASTYFDLCTALVKLSTLTEDSEKKASIIKQAKLLLQKSLDFDPLNSSYWVMWGNLHFVDDFEVAKDAYIKALERDSKNCVIWTHLGLLYLYNQDLEPANQALYRAQIIDPDYVLAWIGQGLVATENQHHTDSYSLFSHAVDISSETSPADLEFAKRAFEKLVDSSNKHVIRESLLPPFHALDRYCKRQPDDPAALHLLALICERLDQTDLALDLVTRSIALLEKTYEETEDQSIEENYAMANGTLGRIRLASQDYSGAVAAFAVCLSLLSADNPNIRSKIMRAHAQFGSGLAHFKQSELEAALEMFETCLQELTPDMVAVKGHAIILLAQTLWALGSEEARETARNQLLECISIDPQNVTAMATLAAIGILESDDSLVDAALTEIKGLTWDKILELDPAQLVSQLLIQHYISQGREKEALSSAQRGVHMDPLNNDAQKTLATLLLQQKKAAAAASIIKDGAQDDLDSTLSLKAIATVASTAETPLSTAQKAIMLAPWKVENWCTLAYIRASHKQDNTV
ncbi:hypothetical protein Clacol_000357 [Clathrus columnatus]|uniref:Superkiller protein 3 n=1 Tax=Clathrus columnatus TaxID=1419009 RepID=A0AAV4ZYD1_9AGAM|nr:hypothetical protein Clacol_000357 [Clathrus columnatus]